MFLAQLVLKNYSNEEQGIIRLGGFIIKLLSNKVFIVVVLHKNIRALSLIC